MEEVKMYWWNGSDLAGHYAKLLTRALAVFVGQSAAMALRPWLEKSLAVGLKGVRVELHTENKRIYVKGLGDEIFAGDDGDNFIKTCPPRTDCPPD